MGKEIKLKFDVGDKVWTRGFGSIMAEQRTVERVEIGIEKGARFERYLLSRSEKCEAGSWLRERDIFASVKEFCDTERERIKRYCDEQMKNVDRFEQKAAAKINPDIDENTPF